MSALFPSFLDLTLFSPGNKGNPKPAKKPNDVNNTERDFNIFEALRQ